MNLNCTVISHGLQLKLTCHFIAENRCQFDICNKLVSYITHIFNGIINNDNDLSK